uniref:uncharacterized protein isoform X2 n=1 Tax=Myxine glutinosa TaxID=7769 RepID=UPI00358F2FB5
MILPTDYYQNGQSSHTYEKKKIRHTCAEGSLPARVVRSVPPACSAAVPSAVTATKAPLSLSGSVSSAVTLRLPKAMLCLPPSYNDFRNDYKDVRSSAVTRLRMRTIWVLPRLKLRPGWSRV